MNIRNNSTFLFLAALLLFPVMGIAADIVTVTAISQTANTQNAVPVTFGQIFKEGEVPPGANLGARLADGTVLASQFDKKATHADGSLRHAVVSLKLPSLGANASKAITLFTTTGSTSGTAVQVSDLQAAGFDATVSLNVGGTVYTLSAASLLNTNSQRWLSGQEVTEWIVGGPVKDASGTEHPHLAAYFHIRAYAGNPVSRVRVDVSIENGWTFASNPRDFTYDVNVLMGGQNVYSQSSLSHYNRARWHKVFWWGNASSVYVSPDTRYLRDSKAVPNYDDVVITDAFLNGLRSSVAPMDNGDHRDYMPDSGYQPGIGLLPLWDSLYAVSGDARAFRAMLANTDGAGAYRAHYRDRDTGRPISIADHPTATIQDNSLPYGSSSNPHTVDQAHQPSMAYLAYLATGDYFYLEELQFWGAWNFLYANAGSYRQNEKGIFDVEVRGQAWALRTLGQVAYITPDTNPLKAHYIASIGYNMTYNEGKYSSNPGANNLGALQSYDGYTRYKPWMDDFYTASLGYLVDLGFTAATEMRDWKTIQPVGRMGTSEFCFLRAGSYVLTVGTSNSVWYPDFATWYTQSFGANTSCPLDGAMVGYPELPTGYVANLYPALASAVDAGTPGASAAWDRLMNSVLKPDFTNSPIWAVMPRGAGNSLSISFSAALSTIAPGASTNLNWSTSNATSCSASGAWSGSQALSGNVSVSPTSDSTYTLNCTGAQGSTTRSVTVSIASPTVSLGASPASIVVGDNSTLTWSSNNASSCTASGAWSGSKALSGSESVSPGNTGAYTLSCSGAGGTTISSTTVTVRAVGSAAASLQTTFGSDSVGSSPTDWFDSAANNSMASDDSLFSIMSIGGQNVFGTTQTSATNIHSHYVGLGSDGWSNYQYSGRLRISGATDTIGLTFLSDYPNSDRYYRLRREGSSSFYIAPHGTGIECTGTTDTGVTPAANTWYRFSIQAEDLGDRTAVRAKVWAEGSAEPASWQANCDDTGTRLTTGTVGLWSVVSGEDTGSKYWDDLRVEPLATATPSDADADGLLDAWELTYYADLTVVSGSTDTDGDGLTAAQEVTYGTDPTLTDSDGDGDSDGQEVAYGADPTLPTDSLDDHRPAVPAILSPPAAVPLIGYTFDVGSFSDPDAGDSLGASQWQIATDAQFTNLVLDRTLSGRAELEVALGVLDLAASYQIRVRHQDSAGLWSAWSSARAITMASSDVNDSDSNGIDDRYQVSSADTNANGINDPDEGLCNLGDITGNQILGFEASAGNVRCTSVMNETDLPTGSTSEDFPFGIFSFGVDGLAVNPQNPATVEISIYFPNALATDTRWYKYDPSSQQVSDFSSNVTITGNVAVLRLTDGGAGDADGVVNGRITDPSGPVFASSNHSNPPTTGGGGSGSSASSGGGGGAFGSLSLLWLLVLVPLAKVRRRNQVCRVA